MPARLLAVFAPLLFAASLSLPAHAQSATADPARFAELAGQLDTRATRDAARAELTQLLRADANGTVLALAQSSATSDGKALARYALAQIKANELTPLAAAVVELALGKTRDENPVSRGRDNAERVAIATARGHLNGALDTAFRKAGDERKLYAFYREAAQLAGELRPSDVVPPGSDHGRVWVRTNLWRHLKEAEQRRTPSIPVDEVYELLHPYSIREIRPNGEPAIVRAGSSETMVAFSRAFHRARPQDTR